MYGIEKERLRYNAGKIQKSLASRVLWKRGKALGKYKAQSSKWSGELLVLLAEKGRLPWQAMRYFS
jgi:hypothetical protein